MSNTTDTDVRYNAQMVTRYTLAYRKRIGDCSANYYASLAREHVGHLVRMAGEFGEALATYCADEGARLAAYGVPEGHWVKAEVTR